MKKIGIDFITIFLILCVFLYIYQISKYGYIGYLEKKRERRSRNAQALINFIQKNNYL
jgi:hypothetical protein